MILQSATDWLQSMGAFRRTRAQLSHHKVIQFATLGVTRASDGENVVTQPVDQHSDVLGQCQGFIAGGAGLAQLPRRAVYRLGPSPPTRSPKTVALSLTLFEHF